MPLGDILVINDQHRKVAREIADLILDNDGSEKISIAIGAESGAGKSEIAHVIAQNLFKSDRKLKSFIVHTDDFFRDSHQVRNELRLKSNLESIGPSEIDLEELDHVLNSFQRGKQILVPILEFITSSAYKLVVDFEDIHVLICEGLYAPILDVTYKVFADLTYHDTKDFRVARGKEVVDEFRMKVLEKEHQAVSKLRENADYLITRDYSLTKA